ncbi:metal-dependent transcriptional regulator [Clostridium carnis]
MKLQESGENYLETILILEKKNGMVRSIDIANTLGFSKPSVSRAINILKSHNFISVDNTGIIKLTDTGRSTAEEIYKRHMFITKYLMATLNLDEETAEKDACKIEHILSEKTFEKIVELFKDRL